VTDFTGISADDDIASFQTPRKAFEFVIENRRVSNCIEDISLPKALEFPYQVSNLLSPWIEDMPLFLVESSASSKPQSSASPNQATPKTHPA
jgi:hypothetical protein